jgi:hypothetical protein
MTVGAETPDVIVGSGRVDQQAEQQNAQKRQVMESVNTHFVNFSRL